MFGKDFGSLTKEPPLKNLDDTIAAIKPGMTYAALRDFANRTLMAMHRASSGGASYRSARTKRSPTTGSSRLLQRMASAVQSFARPCFSFGLSERLQIGERAFLVAAHQAAITGDIHRQHSRQPPFHPFARQKPNWKISPIHQGTRRYCLARTNVSVGSVASVW